MKVLILYGGKSGEHEVSLRSAASVTRNLDASKYRITLAGIGKDGTFWLQDESVLRECLSGDEPLRIETKEGSRMCVAPQAGFRVSGKPVPADFVFPVLHGTFGEDGTIQSLLEIAGIPYAGAGVLGSAMGMDKEICKIIWNAKGIKVVPWITARKREFAGSAVRRTVTERVGREFGFPVFVKPACAGSSVGASKAEDADSLAAALDNAFRYDVKALVEPFIKAREIECSVTGHADVKTYVPGEIVPTHEFYDYEAKYIDPDGAILKIPAAIPQSVADDVRSLAEKAYRAVELSGFARVDFFLDKNDGTLYLNEVNTIPGFTEISMFAKMCAVSGLEYPALLDHLIAQGMERWKERLDLEYSRQTVRGL